MFFSIFAHHISSKCYVKKQLIVSRRAIEVWYYILPIAKTPTQFMLTVSYMRQILFCNFLMNKSLREQKGYGCDV